MLGRTLEQTITELEELDGRSERAQSFVSQLKAVDSWSFSEGAGGRLLGIPPPWWRDSLIKSVYRA